MSQKLTLMLDNISQLTRQLPVQITGYEIKHDCEVVWKTL